MDKGTIVERSTSKTRSIRPCLIRPFGVQRTATQNCTSPFPITTITKNLSKDYLNWSVFVTQDIYCIKYFMALIYVYIHTRTTSLLHLYINVFICSRSIYKTKPMISTKLTNTIKPSSSKFVFWSILRPPTIQFLSFCVRFGFKVGLFLTWNKPKTLLCKAYFR